MSDVCTTELMMSELKIHEGECKYRPILCPLLSCGNEVPYIDVLKHIEEKHFKKFHDIILQKDLGFESQGDPLFITYDFSGNFFASRYRMHI